MLPKRNRLGREASRLFRGLKIESLENRLYLSGEPIAAVTPLGGAPFGEFVVIEPEGLTAPGEIKSAADSDSVAAPEAALLTADAARAVEAINRFALDVYRRFQEAEGNLFLSPMSIATALAMTYAGARGETAAQMADVLHLGTEPGIHESFRALLDALDPADDSRLFDLDIANALWPQQGFPFRDEFLRLIESQYRGGSQDLDYVRDAEGARQIINAWVEQQTHDKIQDLIPPGVLDDLTRLVLTNAIYFKGQWAEEFDPDETRDRRFYLESGEVVDVPTMSLESEFRYCERDGFQVLEMPYKGEELSMVTLVRVRLPKFKTTVSSSLGNMLAGMGMPIAFAPSRANFSGMADLQPGERLYIDKVLHKAFVEVNEEGTEAAAATAVLMGIGCFAAGTPVLTPDGEKPIEEIRPGDYVLSRHEGDVDGSIGGKPVEECFVRQGDVVEVRVGGRVVRTTQEHPFYVEGRGWTAAGDLRAGDRLATHDGRWVAVEGVVDTGRVETVYNMRVADYHTYFVGRGEWGFALWVHNSYFPVPKNFDADHPFHFLIRDNTTGTILFMGRITDPTEEENRVNPSGEVQSEPETVETARFLGAEPHVADGVSLAGPVVRGRGQTLTITASAPGLVDAWIDLNHNGAFDGPAEQLLHRQPLAAGENALHVAVPAGASLGNTLAQFSFSTEGGLEATALAANGEVEEFAVHIGQTIDTVAAYAPGGAFFVRNSNDAGNADAIFDYGPGNATWAPLSGDWDGDGVDTVGLYDPAAGVFHLRNTNGAGVADVVFPYGRAGRGWQPLVGDWDGDGFDTVGVYDPSTGAFYLRNSNSPGRADTAFVYGEGGLRWQPLVGDWDGDGIDTVGVHDPIRSTFYLRNTNDPGVSDVAFDYGPGSSLLTPLAHDLNGDGVDTAGLYDPSTGVFFLRNSHEGGAADLRFAYGAGGLGWLPLTGDWNGPGAALMAAGSPVAAGDPITSLGPTDLDPIVGQAIADWTSAGLGVDQLDALVAVRFVIADLPGAQIGLAERDTIFFDLNAAGHGWFIDPTPAENEEFRCIGNRLEALDTDAVDRIDLLTVVSHELGHTLGQEDVDVTLDGLMSGALGTGLRREPGAEPIDALFARR